MNIIICLDNSKGMLFNGRRQSRDKAVIDDIIKNLSDKKLYISSFSEKLFSDYSEFIEINENFLDNAGSGAFCFLENKALMPYSKNIEKLIVYNWNRDYPADFFCDIDFGGFKLASQEELCGSSHEKITKQIFLRSKNNEK